MLKRVFVSLPLAIYIKFLTDSHFTHTKEKEFREEEEEEEEEAFERRGVINE